MIYFLDSTKVPFIIAHAHHAHVLDGTAPSAYKSPTIFAFYYGEIVSLVCPCSTIHGKEVQSLAALYPTVRLSPWRHVRKNIHSRVWTPGPTWSVLHPGGQPSWFPSVPVLGDMGLTPGDWSGLLSRVATPGTTRSCLPPGGLLSWSPYH